MGDIHRAEQLHIDTQFLYFFSIWALALFTRRMVPEDASLCCSTDELASSVTAILLGKLTWNKTGRVI